MAIKRDSGYSVKAGSAGHEGRSRQSPGGNHDDTPGQIGMGKVSANVAIANPSRLDSTGGSEFRGRDNSKL